MKKVNNEIIFESLEEEKEYWEKKGPMARGAKSRLAYPETSEKLSSFLSVRLSGKEITQLRDLAAVYDCGLSTLVRNILLAYLQHLNVEAETKPANSTDLNCLDKVYESLSEKLPAAVIERVEALYKADAPDSPEHQSLSVMDPDQIRELTDLSIRYLSQLTGIITRARTSRPPSPSPPLP